MRTLEIDKQTNLNHLLSELKTMEDSGLELTALPGEKTILDNQINRKIIEKAAKEFKKEVKFPEFLKDAVEHDLDDFGFVEGEDISTKLPMKELAKAPKDEVEEEFPNLQPPKASSRTFSIGKIFQKKAVFAAGAIMLILGGLGVVLAVLPTASVTITLASTDKDTDATVTASADQTSVDTATSTIGFTTQTSSQDGSDSLATTTKKTIGTNATGRVTITNRDTVAKQYLAGTTLTPVGVSGVTFKLNTSVSLAADTFGDETGVKVGVDVTASSPGDAGNLAAGSSFKVGSESSPLVYAKNDLAFSGGATQQVTVATQSDRDTLKSKIVNKLTASAQDEIKSKDDTSLIPDGSITTTVIKETYTPSAVDAQSDTLKASISLKSSAILVKKADLFALLEKKVESEEKGFKVDSANTTVSASMISKNPNGTYTLTAKISAKLLPTVSKDTIVKKITGKSLTDAGNYLNSLDNVAGYKVTTQPSIFRVFGRLPFFANKITVHFVNQ